jgi:hypothetical protein
MFYSKTAKPVVLKEQRRERMMVLESFDSESDGLELSEDDDIEDPTYRPILSDDEEAIHDEEETVVLHIDDVDGNNNDPQMERPRRKKRKSNYIWNAVTGNQPPKETPPFLDLSIDEDDEILSPMTYFKGFFSDDFLDQIVHQCNLYAVQKNPNKPLNLSRVELEQWIGISLRMSLTRIGSTRQHWSSECLKRLGQS